MTSETSVEPQVSLNFQRVCEGVAFHSFHVTARKLNTAAKSYAAQTWGGDKWVAQALPVLSKRRRSKLFARTGDYCKVPQKILDELWDTYDILVMLERAVAVNARRPDAHREGTASEHLVLFNNLSEAISLRMLISHSKSPPPANVISSLVAYGKVLGQLGLAEEMKRMKEVADCLGKHVRLESVGIFPPEAIRGAAVLTAYYHAEETLRHYCTSREWLVSKFKAEELLREKNNQRQMELSDLLSFIKRTHSEHLEKLCANFSRQIEKPLREFRNRLFHSPDALLPSTEVIGPNSFWKKYMQVIAFLGHDPSDEVRQHVDRMLTLTNDTSLWKRKTEVCCFVTHSHLFPSKLTGMLLHVNLTQLTLETNWKLYTTAKVMCTGYLGQRPSFSVVKRRRIRLWHL